MSPANTGGIAGANVAVTNAVRVKVTDAGSNVGTADVAIQGITVGAGVLSIDNGDILADPWITVMCGTPLFTFQAWVNGSANQSVTASMSSPVGTLSGLSYTAPSSCSSPDISTITFTSVADTNATYQMRVTVVPSPVLVNVGGYGSAGHQEIADDVDPSGNTWWSDASEYGTFGLKTNFRTGNSHDEHSAGWLGGPPPLVQLNYHWVTPATGDLRYNVMVPNGPYVVSLYEGVCTAGDGFIWMAETNANGQIVNPNPTYSISAASWSGNIATITVGPHTFHVSDRLYITGVSPAGYNGSVGYDSTEKFVVTAVTGTTVSFNLTTNPGAYVSGGTVFTTGFNIQAQAGGTGNCLPQTQTFTTMVTNGIMKLNLDGLRGSYPSLAGFSLTPASSITVTSPTSNQTVSGFGGISFAVAIAGPAPAAIKYTVNGYDFAIVKTPPFTFPFNTFSTFNGNQQVTATSYDALGNVLATSPPQPFTTANTWPCPWTPGFVVTADKTLTNPLAGIVNITGTVSGSGSGHSKAFNWWVDGVQVFAFNSSSAAQTFGIDTSRWSNGTHILAATFVDNTGGTSYVSAGGTYVGGCGEWASPAMFSNGNAPMQLLSNAREIYLAPAATFALSGTVSNADGTTMAVSPVFYSQNPSVATVNQSTGLVTAVARGNAQIRSMAPQVSGTDLRMDTVANTVVFSTAHPFARTAVGQVLYISAGTGWTTGFYEIVNWDSRGAAYLSVSPAPVNTAGGTFQTGPSATSWVLVNNQNILPHLAKDGSGVLTAYNPSKSFVLHSMFFGGNGFSDQPYTPGFASDVASGAYNAFEWGVQPNTMSTSSTDQLTFTSVQNGYVSTIMGYLAPFPKFGAVLATDTWNGSTSDIYATTRGAYSAFSPSAVQIVTNSWIGKSNPVFEMTGPDEVNTRWDHKPLQGPVKFNGGTQSGLTSIVASGGNCTVNWTDWSINAARKFMISGFATAGMNSTPGTVYTDTRVDANTFTFPCAGVANGTYNYGNDPNLTIEPYAVQWFAGNTDYTRYDAFAYIRREFLAVAGNKGAMTWPNAASTTNESIACWEGNSAQCPSTVGTVTALSDSADIYTNPASPQNYLSTRFSLNSLLPRHNTTALAEYGSAYDPNKPIVVATEGWLLQMGMQGYSIAVASCSGNTITTSVPHGILNVIPGVTKLWTAGTSGGGCDGNFYVIDAPTSTTINVVRAATSFTGTATGGTLTFSDGGTETLVSATATGTNPCGSTCGDSLGVTADANLSRHRGRTFIVAAAGGTAQAQFNNRTFLYTAEGIKTLTTGFRFREIPLFSANTGGTATINVDNTYIKGRNASYGWDGQPEFTFDSVLDSFIERAAGQRLYKLSTAPQGYDDSHGFYFNFDTLSGNFNDQNNTTFQLASNPHFESGASVPMFHAANTASTLVNADQQFWLAPTCSSVPDYGRILMATARCGPTGKMLAIVNLSDGPQTFTVSLSPYLQSGQSIVRRLANYQGIDVSVLAPGTASNQVTVQMGGAVVFLFPSTFSGFLRQPTISARLADVPNASRIAVLYSYDPYFLDQQLNAADCGTGSCTLSADRNIGTLYYRLLYLDSTGAVLATSDVQTL